VALTEDFNALVPFRKPSDFLKTNKQKKKQKTKQNKKKGMNLHKDKQ